MTAAGLADFPRVATPAERIGAGADVEVVELALLVTRDDLVELERAAGAAGVTVACLLRLLVRHHIGRAGGSCPPATTPHYPNPVGVP